MSTKTLRKRIALVAVAALSIAGLSAVPAFATGNTTATITSVTDGTTANGKLVVYNAGTPISAVINVATSVQLSQANDKVETVVSVTGPSLASPAATDQAVSFTLAATAVTGLTTSVVGSDTLRGVWASGTSGTGALAIGTVTFTPTRAGVYTISSDPIDSTAGGAAQTGTDAAVTTQVSVGGNSVLVPTVGTSITANNAVTGQTNGLTTFRYQPAGFTKTASAVTTYFATVDAGSIDSVANSSAAGTTAAATPTNAWTNGLNNSGGAKLILTIAAGAAYNNGGTDGTGVAPAYWDITLNSGGAASQTLTIRQLNATTGAITTVATATATYTAAPAFSAGNSTSVISKGTTYAPATAGVDDVVLAARGAAQVANVKVVIKDQFNNTLGGQTLSATISGPGLIKWNQSSATQAGSLRTESLVLTAGQSDAFLGISADGTAGVGTITISVGTTVLATEKVTFYGPVATLTAKQNHVIASTAGATLGSGAANPAGTSIATLPAVILTAKDANGNLVPGLTITAKSSDTTVMSETITINGDDGTGLGNGAGAGTYNVAVNSVANTSGKTATLSFRVLSGTTVLAETAPVSYRLGGAVDKVALSLDKASYTAGSAAVATLTLTDDAGNPAFDADHAGILAAALGSSLSVVKTLQFNLPGATAGTAASSVGGKATLSFNAPANAAAEWTISGTTGTGPGTDKAKSLSAKAAVVDASAAIQTQITALVAAIAKLQKAINKIQKRLNR